MFNIFGVIQTEREAGWSLSSSLSFRWTFWLLISPLMSPLLLAGRESCPEIHCIQNSTKSAPRLLEKLELHDRADSTFVFSLHKSQDWRHYILHTYPGCTDVIFMWREGHAGLLREQTCPSAEDLKGDLQKSQHWVFVASKRKLSLQQAETTGQTELFQG